jgi:uncharacterized protein (DUF2132 family)
MIQIRCFLFDPSINSSLKFLRLTPWARQKVEEWYVSELDWRIIADPTQKRHTVSPDSLSHQLVAEDAKSSGSALPSMGCPKATPFSILPRGTHANRKPVPGDLRRVNQLGA